MEKFSSVKSVVVPLNRANVDTDAIIPKQFLKSIKRTGFGPNLFDEWRYLDAGSLDVEQTASNKRQINPDFVLNKPEYKNARILLTQSNFGCGSSREHAPWALGDYGFKAIIAPSYADIFYNNCFKNGLLPIVLDQDDINYLFELVTSRTGYELSIDLTELEITLENGSTLPFTLSETRRLSLINGLDEIGKTLQDKDRIIEYENKRKQEKPWLFKEINIHQSLKEPS